MKFQKTVAYCLSLFFTIFIFTGCSKDSITSLPAISAANNKITGASANDFLSSANFATVKIKSHVTCININHFIIAWLEIDHIIISRQVSTAFANKINTFFFH